MIYLMTLSSLSSFSTTLRNEHAGKFYRYRNMLLLRTPCAYQHICYYFKFQIVYLLKCITYLLTWSNTLCESIHESC